MTDRLESAMTAPEQIAQLPEPMVHELLVEATVLQARLACVAEIMLLRLLKREAPATDRLLAVGEAAAMLGVDERWIRRRARVLPFVRRISGKAIRVSEDGLKRWVAGRRVA